MSNIYIVIFYSYFLGVIIHAAKLPSSGVDSVYLTIRSGLACFSAPLLALSITPSLLIYANFDRQFLKICISFILVESFLILFSPLWTSFIPEIPALDLQLFWPAPSSPGPTLWCPQATCSLDSLTCQESIWPLGSLLLHGSLAGVGMYSILNRHDGPPLAMPHLWVSLQPGFNLPLRSYFPWRSPPSSSARPLLPIDLACASISMVYLFPTS